jgi:hypothetical protein
MFNAIETPDIPQPSTRFTENSREYHRLRGIGRRGRTLKEEDERQRLYHELEAEFITAWGFRPDKGKASERFYWKLANTPFLENKLFDHITFFRRGKNLVIVSQPYFLSASELTEWANGVNASVRSAKEWRHYHPGAALFFVEFTPGAKAKLDARMRGLRS